MLKILLSFDGWLYDLGPNRDAHNERIKLFSGSLNAVGLASLIGGVVSPVFDPSKTQGAFAVLLGVAAWIGFLFAAHRTLGYIRTKD